ncbi:Two component regulator propeller [Parapedobacter composti]|uniref:histidine kinase n=1 Tax=Parapedobacter composti TaxID=623281 RepID=A0A1I1DXP5_9SPHI|nr:two-component regulator propeller domain-containing protein [Parapedobacter composti]SFB79577.1 Two component regulator propeller [Parapedobacter composti]
MNAKLLIFWLIVFLSFKINVVSTPKEKVKYLGIEQGLSNNYVTAIFQDNQGFMWFGTQNGLNRYDGYQFKVYNHQPGNRFSLADNRITEIISDSAGRIWVALKKGVSILDGRGNVCGHLAYSRQRGDASKVIDFAVYGLAVDAKGTIFAASERAGLLRVDAPAHPFTEALQVPLQVDGEVRFEYYVHTLDLDRNGNVWLVVHGIGLCRYMPETQQVHPVSNTVHTATCMVATDDGDIWMGTDNGLFRYRIATRETRFYGLKDGLSSVNIATLYHDGARELWVGTDGGGITIIDTPTDKCTYLTAGNHGGQLTSGAVFSVFRDAASRYWIGTLRGGINVLDPKGSHFQVVRHSQAEYSSSARDFILSFAEDRSGNVWIGTDGAGLTYWNRRQHTFTHYQHVGGAPASLSNDFITNLLVDRQGWLWVATYGGGINKFDERSGTFARYPCYNTQQHYENGRVWRLYEDREGIIWAGTLAGGGLYQFNRVANRFDLYDPAIQNVLTIWEDSNSDLWFGTFTDLIRLDRKTQHVARFNIGHSIRFIRQGGQDSLWIGTEGGGLLHFAKETGVYTSYTVGNGLPDNVMLNVLEDDSGNFWIATFNGIAKFNPQTKAVRNFYQSDGLQSNQFNYNAALRLQTGEFLFGGIHGFNRFFPDSINAASAMPRLVLTDLRINNQPYNLSSRIADTISLRNLERLVLPYDEAVISIGFSALEYSSPDKIRYAYFLEGWDKSWNEVGTQRTAHYSRLEPGGYTLHIRSTNADGEWNTEGRMVAIEVLPPWWRTTWAYGLYLLIVLGMGYTYLYYVRRQTALRYDIKIARLEIEKEKELNEKKLAFFTHISHELRAPLTLIINPVKEMLYNKDNVVDSRELVTVYNNSRRLLSLVDQLLLFRQADKETGSLKLARLDMVALCREVFLCFRQYAASKGIDYSFSCGVEQIEIYADREKIEIVLFNLISNALKFTPKGGRVTIEARDETGCVAIQVADTGAGIPDHVGDAVFNRFYRDFSNPGNTISGFGIGLFLVKKIVESHHGSVSYTSKEGSGTCFTVKLLKGKQHLGNSYIFEDIGEHSVFLEELLGTEAEYIPSVPEPTQALEKVTQVMSQRPLLLVIDDNEQIRHYVRQLFESDCEVQEAASGEAGLQLIKTMQPDIVISDVIMSGCSGIELCSAVKQDPSISHIPIILLTASSTAEIKLKGIESGADDYITKPFDKGILQARVHNILKSRNQLQQYFYNEVTLRSSDFKVATEYRDFLDRCITVVEQHLDNPEFNVGTLADEMGMSQSNLYKRVKSISGRSTNEFIRFIRLRKVAQLLISTDYNVSEAAFTAGFNDMKYFREQFHKLFGIKPSAYKKKFQATMAPKNYRFPPTI